METLSSGLAGLSVSMVTTGKAISPNIYKEPRKTTSSYCHTAPVLLPLTYYGNPILGPVWPFPHGPPYCFRLFHATTRQIFFIICVIFRKLSSCMISVHYLRENNAYNYIICKNNPKLATKLRRPSPCCHGNGDSRRHGDERRYVVVVVVVFLLTSK